MMKISSEQIDRMQGEPDQEFATAMCRYLTERFSLNTSPVFDAVTFEAETTKIIAYARQLGLPRYDGYASHALHQWHSGSITIRCHASPLFCIPS